MYYDNTMYSCRLFSSSPLGIWQLKSPHPWEFAIQGKKNASTRGSPREGGRELGAGGIDWCINPENIIAVAVGYARAQNRFHMNVNAR